MASTIKNVGNRDIEPIVYVYDNDCPVEVQIWDQVDHNLPYFQSQNYLQSKNGVVYLINPAQPENKIAPID